MHKKIFYFFYHILKGIILATAAAGSGSFALAGIIAYIKYFVCLITGIFTANFMLCISSFLYLTLAIAVIIVFGKILRYTMEIIK